MAESRRTVDESSERGSGQARALASADGNALLKEAWGRVRDSRPETRIAVAAAVLGLLLLPVDWPLGWITAGMSASTRATIAAGALTSAAVTAALSTFEHRRFEEERQAQTARLDDLAKLAEEPAFRLLIRIANGYRMAVSTVLLAWEDRSLQGGTAPASLDAWTKEDLNLLSKVLTWQTLHLRPPGVDMRPEDVEHCQSLLVCCHLASDSLSAAKKHGLPSSIQSADPDIPDIVRTTMDRLDRIADALMTQSAPNEAERVLKIVNRVETLWRVSDRHLPWGADLAEDLVGSYARISPGLSRRELAMALFADGDDEGWLDDPEARRAWLGQRRRRVSTLADGVRLPRDEDARSSPRQVRGVDDDGTPRAGRGRD